MKAYYFVFIVTLILSLLIKARTDKQWRSKLFFTFFPLFLFGAIRVDFGNDYSSYEEVYNMIHGFGQFRIDSEAHVEAGYQILNLLMPNFRTLLVLNAFLLSLSLGTFCYRFVPRQYLYLVILLLFLNPEKNIYGTLVAMRSGLCVSSFLLASVFIWKRKIIPFLIITALLAFIHTSSAIFMPLAYLVGYNRPFKNEEVWMWIAVIVVLLFMSLSQIFSFIDVFISNDLFDRYQDVLSASGLHRGFLATFANIFFVFLFIRYFQERGITLTPEYNSIFRIAMLFSVFFVMGSLSMRSSYFYDMFFIAAIAKVFSDKKASSSLRYLLVFLALASSYYSMFTVWMGSPWWNHATYHSLLGHW